MKKMLTLAAAAGLSLNLLACGGSAEPPPAAVAGPGDAASSSTASNGAAPAGGAPTATGPALAPLSSQGQRVSGGEASGGAGIAFTIPESWREEAPSSSMRLAQAAIPGDAGEGQLAAFFFGPGGGGGVEANLQRWVGQMVVTPGTEPMRETFESNGFRITWIEVSGTLKASTMGTGPTTDQPGSRLMGAVVEGDGGPWFFKVTGPDATLDANRETFKGFLRSVRRG